MVTGVCEPGRAAGAGGTPAAPAAGGGRERHRDAPAAPSPSRLNLPDACTFMPRSPFSARSLARGRTSRSWAASSATDTAPCSTASSPSSEIASRGRNGESSRELARDRLEQQVAAAAGDPAAQDHELRIEHGRDRGDRERDPGRLDVDRRAAPRARRGGPPRTRPWACGPAPPRSRAAAHDRGARRRLLEQARGGARRGRAGRRLRAAGSRSRPPRPRRRGTARRR